MVAVAGVRIVILAAAAMVRVTRMAMPVIAMLVARSSFAIIAVTKPAFVAMFMVMMTTVMVVATGMLMVMAMVVAGW